MQRCLSVGNLLRLTLHRTKQARPARLVLSSSPAMGTVILVVAVLALVMFESYVGAPRG
jgi:hypothetical protein